MILIHRITPFLIGLVAAMGFSAATLMPGAPFAPLIISFVVAALLYGRLGSWNARTFDFWNLAGMPLVFLLTSMGHFLFLETTSARILIAVFTAIVLLFYTEHLFSYLHLPARYQAYSIEYLSLVMNLLSAFALSAIGFGVQQFLQTPIWIVAPLVMLVAFFLIHGTLWASKVERHSALLFGVAGALLFTELFIALSYLPSGFYTNAAIATTFFYVYLGLSRAHFIEKLNVALTKRYAIIAALLSLAVLASAQWV